MKEYAFGIDLGGTTAKVGLFTTSGALLEKWEVPTDTSNAGEHILENLADAIHAKMAEKEITSEQVEGVGIGVPGPVLDSRVVPIICANLGGWGERNVSAQLSGLLDGMKVLVGNDANVAALGEIWMGTEGLPQRSHGHAGYRRRRRRHRQRQSHRRRTRCRR
jgi:glucokinase